MRHYQGCTSSSWCGVCVYICMEVHVPVSNVVTYGNGMGTKNVLKRTVHLGYV